MNTVQRVIILAAIALIVLSVLFPVGFIFQLVVILLISSIMLFIFRKRRRTQ